MKKILISSIFLNDTFVILISFFLQRYKSTQRNDLSGVSSLAKKALNKLSSQRLVPIQEAVHEIMTYDLVITSEKFTTASLSQCQKLQTQKEKEETKSTNVVTQYINRPDHLDHHHSNNSFTIISASTSLIRLKRIGYSWQKD